MNRRTGLTAAALLVLAASCSDDPVGPRRSALVTRITVPGGPVGVAAAFQIDVTVENHGKTARLVTPCPQPIGYRVRAADGTVVLESGERCSAESDTLWLDRGEQLAARFELSLAVVPGTYTLEAGLAGYEDSHPWGSATVNVAVPAGTFAISATLAIDTYSPRPPDFEHPMAVLLDESTEFVVLLDSVTAVKRSDFTVSDVVRIRSSAVDGFGSHWFFSNPLFTSVWGGLLEDERLTFSAARLELIDGDGEWLEFQISVAQPITDLEFRTWTMSGDADFVLDGDGIPIMENDTDLSGNVSSAETVVSPDFTSVTGASVAGAAEVRVHNARAGSNSPAAQATMGCR